MSSEPQDIFDGIQVLAEQVQALRVEVHALRNTGTAPAMTAIPLVEAGRLPGNRPTPIPSQGDLPTPEQTARWTMVNLYSQLWFQIENLKETVLKSLNRAAKKSSARLLSKSAAARRLNISRNDSLEFLIRSKQLTVVQVGKRLRIPAADVERLAQSGFLTSASTR